MSDHCSTTNTIDDLLPCIAEVRLAADRLEKAALEGPPAFPSLDRQPATASDVEAVIATAIRWAAGVKSACSNGSSTQPRPADGPLGLAQLFEISSGLPDRAVDVLGRPPVLVWSQCGAAAVIDIGPGGPLSPASQGLDPVDDWERIRSSLLAGHQVVLAQVSIVLGWVRQRLDELERSAVPQIVVEGRVVTVRFLGRLSRGEVTPRHEHILHGWKATGRSGIVTRNVVAGRGRRALLARFPQLRAFVRAAKPSSRYADTGNEGDYILDERVRQRMVVRPAPEM